MDRGDIAEAIDLFRYSSTVAANARARAVAQTLLDLYRRDEIGFHNLGRPRHHGEFLAGRPGHDLQLNINFFNHLPEAVRLARLSLLLVHEGTHSTVDFAGRFDQWLYDEMAARMVPILYYQELSGPGVFNEHADPPRPGHVRVVRLGPGSLPEFERQSRALRRGQLIDDILSISTYQTDDYITPPWIANNLANWGGLRNRWPETRGLYIRVLAGSVDTYYSRLIVDIMESINRREDWDEMMGEAGSLRSIQIALDDLSARPEYGRRIVALERHWNARLREQIP